MKCRLCRSEKHNARKCPKNPDKGKKKNFMKKRMQDEIAPQAVESSNSAACINANVFFAQFLFIVLLLY
jgi:hypothetical protein